MTVRSGDDLSEDASPDSGRAIETLIAVTEPFRGMLVERRRSSTGMLLPGMNTRGTGEVDWEADSGKASELLLHDLAVAVRNPDDVLDHSATFTPGAGPGTEQDKRLL